MKEENLKKYLVLKRNAFQSGTRDSQNLEQDNCDWQSTCYETTLRFKISLREIFSESGSRIVMKKYDQSAVIQIAQDFGTL